MSATVSHGTVALKAHKRRRRGPGLDWPPADLERLERLRLAGATVPDLLEEFPDRTRRAIASKLCREGIVIQPHAKPMVLPGRRRRVDRELEEDAA